MSLNPIHGKVYSIIHYVIKFVSHLLQVDGFLLRDFGSSTNKTDRHYIAEILLKVNIIWIYPFMEATIKFLKWRLKKFRVIKYKPVNKGKTREPENVVFMSRRPLYTIYNYIHDSLIRNIRIPSIDCYLLYRGVLWGRDRRGHGRMTVEFIATYAISAYHH